MTGLQARVDAALDRSVPAGSAPLGVAISGGGDSTALLHLCHDWAGRHGRATVAATVDHGLRPGSRPEAEAAGRACAALGVAHRILTWRENDRPGNLMANARAARQAILSDWARGEGAAAVALGHSRDDQAETLLMRLARGSGVDGLSGMAEARRDAPGGILWLRPLLDIGRAELRDWLHGRGIGWAEDPTNEDPDFDRIRIRQALPGLAGIGLTPAALATVAANMAAARDALDHYTIRAAGQAASHGGDLSLPLAAFRDEPAETARRLLVAALRFVSGAPYPPRRAASVALLDRLASGQDGRQALDGVLVAIAGDRVRFAREPAAAIRAAPVCGATGIWDRRWRITGPDMPGAEIRALGYHPLPELDWRGAGFDHDAAAALPSIWRGRHLVAAPALSPSGEWRADPLRSAEDFQAFLIAH